MLAPEVGSDRDPGAESSLASQIVELAAALDLRVAVAESLTGGLLAAAIVGVPGASRAFSGGIVAYDTGLKRTLLRVDPELLAERGPVDGEVARQMARGARVACAVERGDPAGLRSADIGVATTGVAGPDPDPQTGQPAGTVWVGLSVGELDSAHLFSLHGSRPEIRAGAVRAALSLVRNALVDLEGRTTRASG